MTEHLQVMTTMPTRAVARRIARELVRARLAACVQVLGPIESNYWWQGKQQVGREWLCLVKTTRARYSALVRRLGALHPYDTPEILALPVAAGSRAYLEWLGRETREDRADKAEGSKRRSQGIEGRGGQPEADQKADVKVRKPKRRAGVAR